MVSKKNDMKKLSILLSFFLILSGGQIFAQNFTTTVPKSDTTFKGSYRFTVNKLDNKLLYYDKLSWKNVALNLNSTATLDYPSTLSTAVSDLTVAVPGARLNDAVYVGAPAASVTATGIFYGWVSAANVVTVRFSPKATEDPGSGLFTVVVLKR